MSPQSVAPPDELRTDASLVEAARLGDRDAFGALARRCHARVWRICLGMTGNPEDAEDLHHDALVEAHIKLDQLRDGSRFGAWLVAIARNLGRMRLREPVTPVADVYAVLEARSGADDHDHEQLAPAYSRLSSPHRTALALHYWEGLSYEEIALLLGIPIGTVMSRLHRAREQLRDRMRLHPDGQEQEMTAPDEFVEDVRAEIDILDEMFRDTKQPVERLSVILERSPRRVTELLACADGMSLIGRLGRLLNTLGSRPHMERLCGETREEALLRRLGKMLRWIDRPGFDVVARQAFSDDSGARARARVVLQGWVATDPAAGGGTGGRAYWLLDHLHGGTVSAEDGSEFLLDVMPAARDATTRNLLAEYLLCDIATAFPLLTARFRADGDRHALYALARTGGRFCRELLIDLAAAEADAPRLLDAIATVALGREPAGSKWAKRPVSDLALRQRGTDTGAPYSPTGLDDDILRDVTEAAGEYLAASDPTVRAAAVRSLRSLAVEGVVDTLVESMSDPDPAPRLEAVIGLGELGGSSTVDVLVRATRSDNANERNAANQSLGHQRSREIAATVARLDAHPRELRDKESRRLHAPFRWTGDRLREWLKSSDLRSEPVSTAPADDPRKPWKRPGRSEATRDRLLKVRGDGDPPFHISVEAAVRALPEDRPYPERELTYLIGQAVGDYSTTRRHLVMDKSRAIMRRAGGVYEFTEHGRAVWRIERHIAERYLRDA